MHTCMCVLCVYVYAERERVRERKRRERERERERERAIAEKHQHSVYCPCDIPSTQSDNSRHPICLNLHCCFDHIYWCSNWFWTWLQFCVQSKTWYPVASWRCNQGTWHLRGSTCFGFKSEFHSTSCHASKPSYRRHRPPSQRPGLIYG